MTSFVLLHGAFHGAWCWRSVAARLRAAGHTVFTPTQTGLGERAHLLRADITLDTFVQDLVAVLETEELEDAVLVGHSFGGIALTGAAVRARARIRHLVYLDSLIPVSGETPLQGVTQEVAALRRQAAAASGGLSVPPPAPAFFGIPPGPAADWVHRRMTPHPFGAFDSAIDFDGPPGNGLPSTYVFCTDPVYEPLAPSRARARAVPGWVWRDFAASHDAMVTHPEATAELLMELGRMIDRLGEEARLCGAVVHAGTVYLAGQVADDPSLDAEGQTADILRQIDHLLEQAGTDKQHLLSLQIFLADMADFAAMNRAYDAWLDRGHKPARATVQAKLADPAWRVEITGIAALPPIQPRSPGASVAI